MKCDKPADRDGILSIFVAVCVWMCRPAVYYCSISQAASRLSVSHNVPQQLYMFNCSRWKAHRPGYR